jgi:capsid protein
MQFLDPGEDIKFTSPSDVGGNYEAFMRQQLRSIAVGVGLTYEQLTSDLTEVNYSSIRAGLIEFRRKAAQIQHHLMVYQFCRPV